MSAALGHCAELENKDQFHLWTNQSGRFFKQIHLVIKKRKIRWWIRRHYFSHELSKECNLWALSTVFTMESMFYWIHHSISSSQCLAQLTVCHRLVWKVRTLRNIWELKSSSPLSFASSRQGIKQQSQSYSLKLLPFTLFHPIIHKWFTENWM